MPRSRSALAGRAGLHPFPSLEINNMLRTISTLFITLLALGATAQAGFNYQAVLRADDGSIRANESVSMTFEVRQGAAGGSAVYTEDHSVTTTDFGVVNAVIGQGTTTDDFSSIDWANGPYFLNVAVDGDDLGTTQFMSVPYAEHAANAAWTDDANGINVQDDRVGIGTASGDEEILSVAADHLSGGGVPQPTEAIDVRVDTLSNQADLLNLQVNDEWDDNAQAIELSLDNDITYQVNVGGETFIDTVTEEPAPRTMYGNSTPMAYGYFNDALIRQDYGIESITNPSTGEYVVTLDNEWVGFPVVQITSFDFGGRVEVVSYNASSDDDEIEVHIVDENENPVDSFFSMIVYGTPND